MVYEIREVSAADQADDIEALHRAMFNGCRMPSLADGHWWLAFCDFDPLPVAFASVVASDRFERCGYFSRVGVLPEHRGHGLQRRLMRAVEMRCRRNDWSLMVSDTTDNVPSANNFIRAGWRLFEPRDPWAFPQSLYWTKGLA